MKMKYLAVVLLTVQLLLDRGCGNDVAPASSNCEDGGTGEINIGKNIPSLHCFL